MKEKSFMKKIALLLILCMAAVFIASCESKQETNVEDTSTEVVAEESDETVDVREILDDYESFMDDYIAFMEKYQGNEDAASMLSDYSDMVSKYSEWVGKIDEIDENSLSTEDYDYYIEVTTRVLNKLSKANL